MFHFDEVMISDANVILNWRTKKRITESMLSDIEQNIDKQIAWIKNCYNQLDYYHWIIKVNKQQIGLININNFDLIKKTAICGIYIGSDDHLGIGGLILPYLYNFCFDSLKLNTLYAEVFYSNTSLINLHLFHGYKFIKNSNKIIKKNNNEILIIRMQLEKESFLKSKLVKYKALFPINMWNSAPGYLK